MLIDPPDVLPNLWLDVLQNPVVHGIISIAEDELGPCEDAQLIAEAV
jgi:hypothetical protein